MSENEIVSAQHAVIGNVSRSEDSGYQRTQHPDAQWLPHSLGLFIHWGISSVKGTGDLSWSMMMSPPGTRSAALTRYGPPAVQAVLSPNDYWKQAEGFKPDRYDPRKCLAAAKEAGFEYAVLTTKHHDGYTLWPSEVSDFGVQKFLPGVDLIREYIEACRECGLKVGLYYSPPDWLLEKDRVVFGETTDRDGNVVAVGVDHEPIDASALPSFDEPEFKSLWNAQVRGHLYELLTNYGQIDVLWFDGSSKDAVTLEELRKLQPGILFNPRGLGHGDYETAECVFPTERPSGWWEYCHIWNDGAWGYLNHETYKPLGWMIGEWAKARAWGGAFLANVGLDAHGELPATAYQRFAALAAWQKEFGSTLAKDLVAGPWPVQCNAPAVLDGSKWYLHLGFDWDEAEVVVKGVQAPKTVRLWNADRSMELAWRMEGGDLKIPMRKSLRGVVSDVVEIDFA